MWGSYKVHKKRKETQASGRSQKNSRPRKKSPSLPDFWSETAEGKTGVQNRSLCNPKKPGLHPVSYGGQRINSKTGQERRFDISEVQLDKRWCLQEMDTYKMNSEVGHRKGQCMGLWRTECKDREQQKGGLIFHRFETFRYPNEDIQ